MEAISSLISLRILIVDFIPPLCVYMSLFVCVFICFAFVSLEFHIFFQCLVFFHYKVIFKEQSIKKKVLRSSVYEKRMCQLVELL